MVRKVDYNSRKKAVLHTAINRYIKNALPVASDEIAREFDLSSATIRNIFMDLEEAGFLKHPYTSGGRVPTDKGYRYYLDYLFQQIDLLTEEKERIVKECNRKIGKFDDALENTSEVISEITHYAGIASFLEWQDKFFYKGLSYILEQPEFKDVSRIKLLIKMVEEKQQLLKIINRDFTGKVKVYIGSELGFPEMENCSLIVASCKMKNHSSGRLAVLGPMRMQYNHIIPTMEYISDCLSQICEEI